jgi:HAD superfamily hydrolase (TIGR01549 family)
MFKFVIFDVDGTLVDSVDLHAQAWQETFRKFGKEIPFQDVRGQIGKGGDQLIPVFFSKEELDKFGKKIEKNRDEIFQKKYLPQTKPFPKVRELFERIEHDSKRIALASSAKEDELDHFKKILSIADLSDAETTAEDAEKSKPDPDIFLAAMKKLGDPPPQEVVVIGDTPYDAIGARKAKLKIIGVLSGCFPENQLRKEGCIDIYRDPADLLARYDESALAKGVPKIATLNSSDVNSSSRAQAKTVLHRGYTGRASKS